MRKRERVYLPRRLPYGKRQVVRLSSCVYVPFLAVARGLWGMLRGRTLPLSHFSLMLTTSHCHNHMPPPCPCAQSCLYLSFRFTPFSLLPSLSIGFFLPRCLLLLSLITPPLPPPHCAKPRRWRICTPSDQHTVFQTQGKLGRGTTEKGDPERRRKCHRERCRTSSCTGRPYPWYLR